MIHLVNDLSAILTYLTFNLYKTILKHHFQTKTSNITDFSVKLLAITSCACAKSM